MEDTLIVDQLKIVYEGPFLVKELYGIIDDFFYERNYDKVEPMNTEQILPEGRNFRIHTAHEKNITSYYRIISKIRLYADGVKQVNLKSEGVKVPMQQGKLILIFDGVLRSDRQGFWHGKPIWWFFHIMLDRYVYADHRTKAETWLIQDIEMLMDKLRKHLNLYKARLGNKVAGYVL